MYLPAVAPPLASAGSIPPVPHASKPAVTAAAAAVDVVAVSMNQARRLPTISLRLVLGSAVVVIVVAALVVQKA